MRLIEPDLLAGVLQWSLSLSLLPGLALETRTAGSLTGAYSLCRPLLLAPETLPLSAAPPTLPSTVDHVL